MNKKSREQIINMYPKLTSKAIQNGGSGASFWKVGGSILESFWGSGRVLAPKCVLGGDLGGSWEPRWVQVEAQDGTRLVPKRHKNRCPNRIIFWCHQKSNFDGFWEGKWRQVGTQIGSKIGLNFERPILQKVWKNKWNNHCFLRFWGSKLGAKFDQKSIKNWSPS